MRRLLDFFREDVEHVDWIPCYWNISKWIYLDFFGTGEGNKIRWSSLLNFGGEDFPKLSRTSHILTQVIKNVDAYSEWVNVCSSLFSRMIFQDCIH